MFLLKQKEGKHHLLALLPSPPPRLFSPPLVDLQVRGFNHRSNPSLVSARPGISEPAERAWPPRGRVAEVWPRRHLPVADAPVFTACLRCMVAQTSRCRAYRRRTVHLQANGGEAYMARGLGMDGMGRPPSMVLLQDHLWWLQARGSPEGPCRSLPSSDLLPMLGSIALLTHQLMGQQKSGLPHTLQKLTDDHISGFTTTNRKLQPNRSFGRVWQSFPKLLPTRSFGCMFGITYGK